MIASDRRRLPVRILKKLLPDETTLSRPHFPGTNKAREPARTRRPSIEEEEEAFGTGMRRNAMEYDAHDVDGDQKLDFGEFCAMVREREAGEHTDAELRTRFDALDADKRGQVDFNEYVRFMLCDALAYLHGLHIVHRDVKPENERAQASNQRPLSLHAACE